MSNDDTINLNSKHEMISIRKCATLGDFYKKNIKIKLKKDADISSFQRTNSICDYRMGCDLCYKGEAYGLYTNIYEILSSNNDIYLDKLQIKFNNNVWYDEFQTFPVFYYTQNKAMIKIINDYNLKFKTNDFHYDGCYEVELYSGKINNNNSCLIDDITIMDKNECCICEKCFKWLLLFDEIEKNLFTIKNPIHFFWKDVINDYLIDIIEFENPDDKYLFCP